MTGGDVCKVLEGCWVNVCVFVSRLGVTEICVCGCAGVGPTGCELGCDWETVFVREAESV